MKVCPQCGETYAEFVDFCFADGTVLALEAAAPAPEEPDAFDAPPPPKMLQGSQQRASYTRSATPVPRARRPGRSLIQSDAAYSPPQQVEPPTKQRTPTPPPAPIAPQPEQMYGDAPEELEGAAPDEDSLDGDVDETWSDEGDDEFFQPQTPPPLPGKQGQVSLSKADHQQWVDDDEEQENSGGLGVFALAGAGFLAVAVVAVAALFAITTMMLPESGTETPETGPTPIPVQPAPPDPVEVPEPAVPEPVEPELDSTDAVEVPGPAVPGPVEPEPGEVVPDPVPVQPQPTRPDPVAAVTPRPQPTAALVRVSFGSTPDGATIYIDGNAIGTTSFMQQIPEGQHRVRMVKKDYEPFETAISVKPGMGGINAKLVPVGGVVAPAPVPAPAPTPTPAPAPTPTPAPTPAPAEELLNTMFFMPGIEPNKAFAMYAGKRAGTSTGAKLQFPASGGKLTVEFRTPDGTTWTETANCSGPVPLSATTARLVITDNCPGITGTQP